MTRVFPAAATLAVSLLTLQVVTIPTLAADNLFPELRPAYPDQWAMSDDNPLKFEAGIRYYHTWGSQDFQVDGREESIDSIGHAAEGHLRIDDLSTNTFVEATAGLGFSYSGTYSRDGGDALSIENARLGYAGADFGWLVFGEHGTGTGVGPLVGYQFTNDTADTGRSNFTTAETSSDVTYDEDTGFWAVGFDSEPNDIDIHAAKIGLTGRVNLGSFDLTGEASATPYAWVNGTLGGFGMPEYVSPDGSIVGLQGSPVSINGFGYGASGKLLVGFHPTENLTVRFGGRASYLEGLYDATYERATIQTPQEQFELDDSDPPVLVPSDPRYSEPVLVRQGVISPNNPFSMFRYGALIEVTGRF